MLVICHCYMFLLSHYIIFRLFVGLPSASSLFLLFSISENLHLEIFLELDETLRRIFIRQKEDLDQRGPGGATQGPGATPSHGQRWSCGWDLPLCLGHPLDPSDAYEITLTLKT